MNQKEPKCECGEAKSKHNLLSLAPGRPGTVRNGPYLNLDGQVFCQKYRETT